MANTHYYGLVVNDFVERLVAAISAHPDVDATEVAREKSEAIGFASMIDSIAAVTAMVDTAKPEVAGARAAYETLLGKTVAVAVSTSATRPVVTGTTAMLHGGAPVTTTRGREAAAYWDLRNIAKPLVSAVLAVPPGTKLDTPTAVYTFIASRVSEQRVCHARAHNSVRGGGGARRRKTKTGLTTV